MTASATVVPRWDSAVSFILVRINALIWLGLYFLPLTSTQASPFGPGTIWSRSTPLSFCVIGSSYRRPIRLLIAKIVFSGLVMLCRFAVWPTRISPESVKATIDGVVRAPSEFSMTVALLPSITATHEFVVPRSIPIARAICSPFFLVRRVRAKLNPADLCERRTRYPRRDEQATGWKDEPGADAKYFGSGPVDQSA